MDMETTCEHMEVRNDAGEVLAIVHAADYCTVTRSRWYIDKSTGYVRRSRDGQYMHRLIMQLGFKSKYRYKVVDHRNGVRNFNCRVCNLRVCSSAENARNRRYNWRERKTSIYRGVCYAYGRRGRELSKPWRAMIRVEKALVSLGYFASQRAAAIAYNEAAERLHGPYMVPNQIEPEHEPEPVLEVAGIVGKTDEEERAYWQARIAEEEAYTASSFLFDTYSHIDRQVWAEQIQQQEAA